MSQLDESDSGTLMSRHRSNMSTSHKNILYILWSIHRLDKLKKHMCFDRTDLTFPHNQLKA